MPSAKIQAQIAYYWHNRGARLQGLLKETAVQDIRAGPGERPEVAFKRLEFKALERIEEKYRPKLRDLICETFRYCEYRRKSKGGELLVAAIADWALSHFGKQDFPIDGFPAIVSLVALVQTQALDRWCNCAGSRKHRRRDSH